MSAFTYRLGLAGREIELSDGEYVLGRSRSCDVRVDEESVSRSHALLSLHGGRATVRDLGSSNGVFVNGARAARPAPVSDGDVLTLGSARLTLTVAKAPADDARTLALSADEAAPFLSPARRAAPAPVLERVGAGLVDLGWSLAIGLLALSPALVSIVVHASLRQPVSGDPIFWVLIAFCASVAGAGVAAYFLSGWCGRGATAGERWFRLRTETLTGRFLTPAQALKRLLAIVLYAASAGILFVATLSPADEGRALADRWTDSRVVRTGSL